jgi:hypothetical protein
MCIHKLSECAWCPSEAMYERRREALSALMARPEVITVPRPQIAARIVPVPSTDDFTSMATGFESASLSYTRQVPRVAYPHGAVTTEAPLPKYQHTARHYVRDIYGEVTFAGMVERA